MGGKRADFQVLSGVLESEFRVEYRIRREGQNRFSRCFPGSWSPHSVLDSGCEGRQGPDFPGDFRGSRVSFGSSWGYCPQSESSNGSQTGHARADVLGLGGSLEPVLDRFRVTVGLFSSHLSVVCVVEIGSGCPRLLAVSGAYLGRIWSVFQTYLERISDVSGAYFKRISDEKSRESGANLHVLVASSQPFASNL
jgi:hypothetical protein